MNLYGPKRNLRKPGISYQIQNQILCNQYSYILLQLVKFENSTTKNAMVVSSRQGQCEHSMHKTRNKSNFCVQNRRAIMKSTEGWSTAMKPVTWAWSVNVQLVLSSRQAGQLFRASSHKHMQWPCHN